MKRYRRRDFCFPLPHTVDEEKKEVLIYIPNGMPTVLAVPGLMKKHYPGYKGFIVSKEFDGGKK